MNGLERLFGNRREIAQKLKTEILDNSGLTASVGIGDNKFLAKVVMDLHAKKEGIAECKYEDVKDKLWPYPIENIWGIGRRMKRSLNCMGIVTLGQLANYDLNQLKKHFGIMGEQLYWYAWGIGLSPIYGNFTKTEQKGFGHGISLLRDYSETEVKTCILDLCEEVCRRARITDKTEKTIHPGISYGQETGGGFSRSLSISRPTNVTMEMYKVCIQLFHKFYDKKSYIRHVYVTLGNLSDKQVIQLDLFEDSLKKNDIGYVMDAIRKKYGSTSILCASSYTDAGILLECSKKIGGHNA